MEVQSFLISGPRDADHLVEELGELLGLEFERRECGWSGETYGGSLFEVSSTGERRASGESAYRVVVTTDRKHPLFRNQQRTFVRLSRLEQFLASGLPDWSLVATGPTARLKHGDNEPPAERSHVRSGFEQPSHSLALVPLHASGFHALDVARKGGRRADVGLLAEGLLYYDRVIVLLSNPDDLAALVAWANRTQSLSTLLSLVGDGTLSFLHHAFELGPVHVNNQEAAQLWTFQTQRQSRGNSFLPSLWSSGLSRLVSLPELDHLLNVVAERYTEEHAHAYGPAVKAVRESVKSGDHMRLVGQALVDEWHRLLGDPHHRVAVQHVDEGEGRFRTHWNFNIDQIDRRLGARLSVGPDSFLWASAAAYRLAWAATRHGCDLFVREPLSRLTIDPLATSLSGGWSQLHERVRFPPVRDLVNDGKLSLPAVLELRKASVPIRGLLSNPKGGLDAEQFARYHLEAAGRTSLAGAEGHVISIAGGSLQLAHRDIGAARQPRVSGSRIQRDFVRGVAARGAGGWDPRFFGGGEQGYVGSAA